MNKKFVTLTGTVVLSCALLTACGEADVKTVDNASEGKNEQKAEKKEEKKSEFKIGETVSVEGMEVTLTKVTWGKAAEYSAPQQGKVLRIEGTVKNNASDNGFIDNTEFQVYANDTTTGPYFGNDDANMLAGELKKGKTAPIVLEFDVPEAESYEIFYEPSFTLKQNAEVKWIVAKGDIK